MNEIMNEALMVAGLLAPVIGIILQAVKQLEQVNNKFLPLISIGIGLAAGLVIAMLFGQDLALYGLAGFLGGATASGLYDALTVNKEVY